MTNKQKYRGVIVPMVTPFTKKLEIDLQGVGNILNGFMAHDCNAFVLGTTGEASSIPNDKKADLVAHTVKTIDGKSLVYAGISGNCFQETVDNAKLYADLGADVLVSHLPAYYPLEPGHMLRYYEMLADAVTLPLVLYNIPVTTNISVPLQIVDRLSHHHNIVGFKDSQRGEDRLDRSLELWKDREDFTFHLGWAAKSSYGLINGLDGIVPSSGNLVPALYRKIYDAAKNGDYDGAGEAQSITDKISAYYQKDKILSNAFPILKVMMKAFGLCDVYVAPPMTTVPDSQQQAIRQDVLAKFGEYANKSADKIQQ